MYTTQINVTESQLDVHSCWRLSSILAALQDAATADAATMNLSRDDLIRQGAFFLRLILRHGHAADGPQGGLRKELVINGGVHDLAKGHADLLTGPGLVQSRIDDHLQMCLPEIRDTDIRQRREMLPDDVGVHGLCVPLPDGLIRT